MNSVLCLLLVESKLSIDIQKDLLMFCFKDSKNIKKKAN